MTLNISKYQWLIAALLGSFMVYFLLKDSVRVDYVKPTSQSAEVQKTVLASDRKRAEPAVQAASMNTVELKKPWTAEDEAIKKDWFNARGYGGLGEYSSYSRETLVGLAKQGDTRAVIALGELAYRVQGYKGAMPAYRTAAIQGSTEALLRLGVIEESSHYKNAKTEEERYSSMLNTLAWYKLASLRGDRWPEVSAGNTFLINNGITLTELDNQRINELSQRHYDRMLQTRLEKGLGEFDNSVPEPVTRYFESWDSGAAGLKNAIKEAQKTQ